MKTNHRTIALAAGLALAALAGQASAAGCEALPGNAIVNCGFESGDFSGWTLAGIDVDQGLEGNLYGVETVDPFPLPDGTMPNSGSFQAFFADIAANPLTLSQTLVTEPGQEVDISFYMAQQLLGAGTVNSQLTVSFGGTTLQTLTNVPVQGYTLYTFQTTATSTSSVFSLTFGNDVGEFIVDDVNVTTVSSVPEPASAATFGVGLLALGLLRQRRRRA